MANICEVNKNDKVLDPSCGTGGFLIAAMNKILETEKISRTEMVKLVRKNLIGFDKEPVTAALCVANMILRGDGSTGVARADCFNYGQFPIEKMNVVLMNPPFPHKKTDIPPERFVDRAIESLQIRGKLAVILPTSLLVKKDKGFWRSKILSKNKLLAVCQLPDELFQPYASSTTSVVLIEKGIPNHLNNQTVFVRALFDGLTLKKGIRVKRLDKKNDIPNATQAILGNKDIPGFSGLAQVSNNDEWGVGGFIKSELHAFEDIQDGIDILLRRLGSFYVRFSKEIKEQRKLIAQGLLKIADYRTILSDLKLRNAKNLPSENDSLGYYFDIYYGMKELHSRDGIPPGNTLIISPTEQYNGCYGWLDFEPLIFAPFITVAQTGSIGESFVQLEPCAVNDDCLLLIPKNSKDLSIEHLFISAAVLHLEKWRFSYGRKLTPSRICNFKVNFDPKLLHWVKIELKKINNIIAASLS